MLVTLKCPKCNEPLEIDVNNQELKAFLEHVDSQKEINNVIVIPTFRCSLLCSYCHYYQQKDGKSIKYNEHLYEVEKELEPEEWISLLNQFSPAVYDFTGGEPLRYQGIAKVLNSLPKWSITSNTLHFTKDIDLSRCAIWTASYHQGASPEAKAKFFENIQYIKSQKVHVGVTLVAQVETIESILKSAETIHSLGFNVHIHPYYDDKTFSWYDHPKEMELLKASPYVVYGEMLFKYEGISGTGLCRGGKNYFAIGPDGKVFRCLTDLLLGRRDIRQNAKPIGLPTYRCSEKCMFPCDFSQRILEKS